MSARIFPLTVLLLFVVGTSHADTARLSQFTTDDGDEVTTTWSPDSEWIAFTATWSGNSDIWKKPVAGGDAVQLTTDRAHDAHAVWSPDGSRIAFSSNRDGGEHIWTISASGGDLVRVTTDEDALYFHHQHGCAITWSPDAQWIAFLSVKVGRRNIWIIPSDGGEARQITDDSRREAGHPEWSADGTHIAYSVGAGPGFFSGADDIWVVPVDGGGPRQLTTNPHDDNVPSWSPDGRWLAFQSNRGGGYDIWVMPATGGTPYQITLLGDAYVPRWSPDGRKISFHTTPRLGKSDIWIADVSDVTGDLATMIHQRIAGRVTLDGEPRANALIRVSDDRGTAYQAMTNQDGRYQIWAEPGSHEVSVEGAEGADPIALTLKSGESLEDIDFAPTAIGNTIPSWPFVTTVVLLGLAALVCVIPLYSRSERFGAVIIAPKQALNVIAAAPDWLGPFCTMLVAGLVLSVAFIGKALPDLGDGVPDALKLPMMIGMPILILLGGLVASVASWTIRSGAIWILARLVGERANFYSLFSVVGYAYMPQVLLAALAMAGAIGFGFVEFSFADISSMVPPTSLLWLLPEGAVGPVAGSLIGQIELFALWSLALTVIGVQRVYAFNMSKAAAVVVLYWVLEIGVAAGFVALMMGFQQLMAGG